MAEGVNACLSTQLHCENLSHTIFKCFVLEKVDAYLQGLTIEERGSNKKRTLSKPRKQTSTTLFK